MADAPYVVVGAGQAGLQICDSLRRHGYSGALVLLGAEPSLPYQRPPLSKKYLAGDLAAERLLLRPPAFYDKHAIQVRPGCTVSAIDPAAHRLQLAGGETLDYARLALATGARIRPLACQGGTHPAIHYVRTLADGERLRVALAAATRVAIVGGGFIGLEVAAMARSLGKEVVVLEALDRLMARAVSPLVSDYFAALHRRHGVELRLATALDEIAEAGAALRLHCGDGTVIDADLVIAGIGVIPNDDLARAAGLTCGGGIHVDAHARTSDPDIVAAGDCTWHFNAYLGRALRLESVQNAVDQAKVAAATLCDLEETYHQVPWFWSDQYEAKLQMAGIGQPADEAVVRGQPAADDFAVFYLRAGRLVGADTVNRAAEHMACRRLLAQGATVTPAELADEGFDLMQRART